MIIKITAAVCLNKIRFAHAHQRIHMQQRVNTALSLKKHQPGYLPSPLSISLDANMPSRGKDSLRSLPQILTTGGQLQHQQLHTVDRRDGKRHQKLCSSGGSTPGTAELSITGKMKACGWGCVPALVGHQFPNIVRNKRSVEAGEQGWASVGHWGSQMLPKHSEE